MKTLSIHFSLLLMILLANGCDKDDGPTGTGIVTWPCGNKLLYVNKIYNIVQIGDQCWLKENLDVGTRISGNKDQTDNGMIEKYCYNDDPANCNIYGGLYTWDEAMQYTTTEGTRGICPVGWHIPTSTEINILGTTIGNESNALKAIGQGTGDGAGTNTSGFSALLGGGHYYIGYRGIDSEAVFWSSTSDAPLTWAEIILLCYDRNSSPNGLALKSNGYSIRCLKD